MTSCKHFFWKCSDITMNQLKCKVLLLAIFALKEVFPMSVGNWYHWQQPWQTTTKINHKIYIYQACMQAVILC